jgi:hypothetical protein
MEGEVTVSKIYKMNRLSPGLVECKVHDRGDDYWLRHVGGHSEGFEMGYNGSGPSDLAYSLLADFLEEANICGHIDTLSEKLHQRFKAESVSRIKEDYQEYAHDFMMYWIKTNVNLDRGSLKQYYFERNLAFFSKEKKDEAQEMLDHQLSSNTEASLLKNISKYEKVIAIYEKFLNEVYVRK